MIAALIVACVSLANMPLFKCARSAASPGETRKTNLSKSSATFPSSLEYDYNTLTPPALSPLWSTNNQ